MPEKRVQAAFVEAAGSLFCFWAAAAARRLLFCTGCFASRLAEGERRPFLRLFGKGE